MVKAKFERTCPKCGKIVRGINPAILETNYAQHTKWHEVKEY
jgi:hypothetical protein